MTTPGDELTLVNGAQDDASQTLCEACRGLGLSVDKFIVTSPSVAAQVPQQTASYKPRILENFRVNTGRLYKDFATFKYLCDNKSMCAFCRLVHGAMDRYSGGGVKGKNTISTNTPYSLQWEIHGQESSKSGFENKTRRIRLSWTETTGHTQEIFLLFVAPKDPLRPNSDAASWHLHSVRFLGREFGHQKKKQALIKSWLDLCMNDHRGDCRVTHGTDKEFLALSKETYFGVIDVADMQLKSLPRDSQDVPEPFVALSYVWGANDAKDARYVTTRKNIMTHIMHGGLETAWEKLPRTLQDAIRLVSLLNYRYIWIDSLCIVKDSQSSWELNTQAIHLVYGHAEFTICAADGCDASSGLLAVSEILLPSSNLDHSPSGGLRPMSEDMGNNVRLMVTRPLEATISDSQWNQRAWTFQERILSRRRVIFAEGKVYFQCRAAIFSQDVYTDVGSKSQSLDQSYSPLRTLVELEQRPFWFYLNCVGMYTGRQLTQPRDVLAAYKGIDWMLSQYMDSPSLFGLPTSHFDLALLWNPASKVCHRRPGDTLHVGVKSCAQDDLGNCACRFEEKSLDGINLPTWSWSGWMGGMMNYDNDILEGCLSDVHEWLRRHTWIQWYVRDKQGHLLPLCDIVSWNSNSQSWDLNTKSKRDKRWIGYPGSDSVEVEIRRRSGRRSPLRRSTATWRNTAGGRKSQTGRQPRGMVSIFTPRRGLYGVFTPNAIDTRRSRKRGKGGVFKAIGSAVLRLGQSRSRYRSSYSDHTSDGDSDSSTTGSTLSRRSVSNERYRERFSRRSRARDRNTSSTSESRSRSRERPRRRPRNRSRSYERRPRNHSNNQRSDSESEYQDNYGRLIKKKVRKLDNLDRPEFQAILPDSPFRVIHYTPLSDPRHRRQDGEKDKPTDFMPILQFFTWSAQLCVAPCEMINTGLCQCSILDESGDWCGAITLDGDWIQDKRGQMVYFIALADAKSFTLRECPTWTYYIPKERDESEWDLYFVLLLQRNQERGLWERVGLGKVFQAAFREQSWDEVKLG